MSRSRRAAAALVLVVAAGSLTVPAAVLAAAPVADALPASTPEDTAATVTLVGIDGDGDPTTFALTAPPAIGSLGTLGAPVCDANVPRTCTTTVLFTPTPNAHGLDSFGFTVSDGTDTVAGTANVAVTSVNDPPIALGDPGSGCDPGSAGGSYPLPEDSAPVPFVAGTACGLDQNDSDVEGDALTYEVVDPPLHGSLAPGMGSDGTFQYQPDADFSTASGDWLSDSFTYRVFDGQAFSVPATVSFWIAPVNDPPTFTPGADVTVSEDSGPTAVTWATAISPGPPSEGGQAVAFEITEVDAPAGLFSAMPTVAPDGTLSFTPGVDRFGLAQVTVRAKDDGGLESYPGVSITPDDTSDAVTFSIAVDPVNDPPGAGSDAYSLAEDGTLVRSAAQGVLADDSDVDAGTTLVAVLVEDVEHGTLSLAANGGFTYVPSPDYHGTDGFTYRASDGQAQSPVTTVELTISPVNDEPSFTKGANQTVLEDSGPRTVGGWATGISAGPADESSQTVNFEIVSVSNAGLFSSSPSVAGNGTLTFTPAPNARGSATIAVRARDTGGTTAGGDDASANQSFTITVTAVNDAPTFTKGANQTVLEDGGPRTIAGWATAISMGPTDEAGQAGGFVVSATNAGLFATAPAVSPSGSLTFTPATNATGSSTVTVSLEDDGGTANGGVDASASKTFTITVTAVNDAPSFTKGSNQVVLEDSGARTVTGWASAISKGPANESGQTVTFAVTTTNAALFAVAPAVSPAGTLTFTPAANRSGSATISVTLHDSGGTANGGAHTSALKTATVSVTSVNDAPTASNDQVSVEAGSEATPVAVLANDSGAPDTGETLSVAAITVGPSNGSAVVTGGGKGLSYMPDVGFTGIDTFTYRLSDGHGGADTATVRVTVTDDVTDPTVSTPRASIVSGVTAGTSTIRVRQTWTAKDGSGIASTNLGRSKDGAAYTNVTLDSPTATKADQHLVIGPTYRYRARATDPAGNRSTWATGVDLSLKRYQDTNASIVYAGGTWSARSVADSTDGSVRFATRAGASATLTATGRAAALIAQKEATSGKVEVWVDGVRVATVDLAATASTARQVVWSKAWTTDASRTIRLVVVGTGRVDIDAIVILGDPA